MQSAGVRESETLKWTEKSPSSQRNAATFESGCGINIIKG
jgi:hypothetical protein